MTGAKLFRPLFPNSLFWYIYDHNSSLSLYQWFPNFFALWPKYLFKNGSRLPTVTCCNVLQSPRKCGRRSAGNDGAVVNAPDSQP